MTEEAKKPYDETQLEGAILCRSRVQLAPTITGEAMYMPAGLQEITPFSGGVGKPIKINVDANGAAEIEAQRAHLASKGRQPYFDFDHADGPASFWIESFSWKPDGIYAKGEWTQRGKQSVEGKEYRYFSPVFYVDDKHGDPARIQCRKGAKANMGALINDPAFHNILPLWAKNASGDAGDAEKQQTEEQQQMEDNEIAALRAKQTELEKELADLKAKQDAGEDKDAEMRSTQLEFENNELKIKAKEQDAKLLARQKDDAKAAVDRAVMRGAIGAKEFARRKSWEDRATVDPSFIKDIDSIKGQMEHLLERHSAGGRFQVVSEDPSAVYCKLAEHIIETRNAPKRDRTKRALEFEAIYSAELGEKSSNRGRTLAMKYEDVREAIKAADVTDANLGTLAGTLVAQRTLELLHFYFPELTAFTTDFSDQPITFNQTVMTRTITIPAVQTYSTTTGWADISAATIDVPVTLNNHKGVTISYNEQIMASTMRKLFDEQAPAQAYALAKNIIDALYAVITDANFTNNTVATGTAFGRSTVVDVGVALNLRGVPNMPGTRTMLLYSTFFGNLQKDATLMQLAAFQRSGLITENQPGTDAAYGITVSGFQVYDAPNLPTNNANLNGFAGSKSALLIVTRIPNDYTVDLAGASYGTVQTVTNPNIGISVMSTQYVDHTLAVAKSRLSIMYGVAAGQTAAGQLIKSNAGTGSSH
jgi:hypothetical protein